MTPIITTFVRGCAAILLAATLSAPAQAQGSGLGLTLSKGPENIETREFTVEELAEIPQVTIITQNEFTDGPVSYRGPLVRDVLAYLGMDSAETVRVFAANDYYVDIPTSDFRRYNVILALEENGVRLSRREKGPVWVMYPISDHPELRDPVYNTRLIWQVVRIESL